MSLSDRLADLAAAQSTVDQVRGTPAGWEPGIRYEPDGTRVVTSGPIVEPDDHADVLAAMGVTVPDGMVARLVEVKMDPAAWHRDKQGDDAVTRPVVRMRWQIVPALRTVDVEELVRAIGRRKAKPVPPLNAELPAYVVATADTQLGDGTTADVIDRFQAKTLDAVARFKRLRKDGRCSAEVYLPWLGDCIQGTVTSAPILKNDLSIVEMLRVYRRLVLWQVQQFMDLAQVTVAAIPGNHDQPLRNGKGPAYDADQSWAVEGILSVADALQLAGHDDVRFIYPDKDCSTVTIDIAGTVVALAHGHQWTGPASKIHSWWAGQSHGRTSPGAADVLLTGHRHHFYAEVAGGDRLAVVCPPLVSSSGYWTEARGDDTAPGLVTMLVGQGTWSGMEIL